jgi:hypothetical protein
MWMSEVAMKVWMRGRSECLIAFQAASMSSADVRVPWRRDRKAGLDHVHAQARELVRDLQLLLNVE